MSVFPHIKGADLLRLCLFASAGLTAFAVGPTTLAQGQTLVAQAGGNTALALMLLVLTNMLAVFTVPFLFKAVLSSKADSVQINSANLLINLVITILAPAIVGKASCKLLASPAQKMCIKVLVSRRLMSAHLIFEGVHPSIWYSVPQTQQCYVGWSQIPSDHGVHFVSHALLMTHSSSQFCQFGRIWCPHASILTGWSLFKRRSSGT